MKRRITFIALEEHYQDPEVKLLGAGPECEARLQPTIARNRLSQPWIYGR
jgi:hypothetical protein